ncbi:MAG: glycosyltransferase family 87 protein [Flavobacteriales bacterium]
MTWTDYIYEALRSAWGKALLLASIVLFIVLEVQTRNDLDIFLQASIDMFSGENIYSKTYFDGYHYYYSMLFAALMRPLASLPAWCSKAIWLCLNFVLLWRIVRITQCYLSGFFSSEKQRMLFTLLLLFVSFRFIRGNLHLCQMTIVMLALSLESIYRIHLHRQFAVGGVLLALTINIKLLPIVLLPYLLYRAQWRAAGYTIFFLALFFALPFAFLPIGYHQQMLAEWWHLINPVQQRHVLDMDETSFHSMSTLLAALFTDYLDPRYGLQTARHIAVLSFEQLQWLLLAVRLTLVLLTLWFLRTRPFVMFQEKEKVWWELSYLMLAVPLIFPHQQHYAFLMSMPALAWMLVALLQKDFFKTGLRYWIAFSCIVSVVIVFNLGLWLGAYSAWYNHYKILTYGALVLLLLIACTSPRASAKSIVSSSQ